jgi:hypothetical protein
VELTGTVICVDEISALELGRIGTAISVTISLTTKAEILDKNKRNYGGGDGSVSVN